MNIKKRFPDEMSLKEFISKNIQVNLKKIRDSVENLESEYIKKSRTIKIYTGILIGSSVIAIIFTNLNDLFLKFTVFIILIIILYVSWKKIKESLKVIRKFNLALNKCIYELIFDLFQVEGEYLNKEIEEKKLKKEKINFFGFKRKLNNFTHESQLKNEIISFLDESELITESRNQVGIDDSYILMNNGNKLRVTELDVKNVTGSGKNRRIKQIFTGLFVILDLPKDLDNKTFVSTEEDKRGFANQSFLNQLTGNGAQLVDLEWNDFEELLHVVSTSQTEARYILTPDFMNHLYQWWKEKKLNIRFAFIGRRMFMLFPDQKIRLDSTVKKIEAKNVTEYMESIAIPLLHILHVVEDVEDRFRS